MKDTIEIKLVRDDYPTGDPRRFVRNVAWPTNVPFPKRGDLIVLEVLVNDEWTDQSWVVLGMHTFVHSVQDHSAASVSLICIVREDVS